MENRYVQQFKKGSLEMILLHLIAQKETYGYELITELNDKGAMVLGYAREGTIYPILYRLQSAELIQCRIAPAAANGGSKKYYSITEKGRAVLTELIDFWQRYTACVDEIIGIKDFLEESK
ncbi:MAG: PadR family transcriptional regulator [Lachnospirales bacterium]